MTTPATSHKHFRFNFLSSGLDAKETTNNTAPAEVCQRLEHSYSSVNTDE